MDALFFGLCLPYMVGIKSQIIYKHIMKMGCLHKRPKETAQIMPEKVI